MADAPLPKIAVATPGVLSWLITPHVGDTEAMARPLLAARVAENVRRDASGEPLAGPVDPDLGY